MPEPTTNLRPCRESLSVARFFEIRLGPTTKVEVRVTAFEDVSLPTPHEREEWKCRRATPAEVAEAAAKLCLNVQTNPAPQHQSHQSHHSPAMPPFIPKVPDFALPLLDNREPATFTRRTDGEVLQGRVFHQKRDHNSDHPHPTDFYVEYPLDSGRFHEVRVSALKRALDHHPDHNPITSWSKPSVGNLFANAPPHLSTADLLAASAPT